jgi:hypothetical protein
MRPVDRYLDRALRAARLAPRESLRIRAEIKEHLMILIERNGTIHSTEEEITAMMHDELGDPEELGRNIAGARGGKRAWLMRKAKRVAVCAGIAALFLVPVRVFAFGFYRIASDALVPCAGRGDLIMVGFLAQSVAANDLIVYRDGDRLLAGIVTDASDGAVMKVRHGAREFDLPRAQVVGRVLLQTR